MQDGWNLAIPSMLWRTFFTFFLQPSQWMETFKTHVCETKEKDAEIEVTLGMKKRRDGWQ